MPKVTTFFHVSGIGHVSVSGDGQEAVKAILNHYPVPNFVTKIAGFKIVYSDGSETVRHLKF